LLLTQACSPCYRQYCILHVLLLPLVVLLSLLLPLQLLVLLPL
jgi:hypothetical protein